MFSRWLRHATRVAKRARYLFQSPEVLRNINSRFNTPDVCPGRERTLPPRPSHWLAGAIQTLSVFLLAPSVTGRGRVSFSELLQLLDPAVPLAL